MVLVVVARRFRPLFFFISLLFRRWRCNQIARPIPRTGIWPDLRGWIDRAEIRRSRFLLRIIATLRRKNRLPGDTSPRSPLPPLPRVEIIGSV